MLKHDARIGMGYDFKAGGIFKDMTFEKERTLLQVSFCDFGHTHIIISLFFLLVSIKIEEKSLD